MNCPLCDSRTKVFDTRNIKRHYRRRQCHQCGYRFTTYEHSAVTLLDVFDEWLDDNTVDEIAKVIELEFPENPRTDRKVESPHASWF